MCIRDRFEAPFEAALFADGFVGDDDEDGIGVGAGAHAEGDPAAFGDGHVEAHIASDAICGDVFLGDGDAVYDDFDRDVV